jgi:hypothetical protein
MKTKEIVFLLCAFILFKHNMAIAQIVYNPNLNIYLLQNDDRKDLANIFDNWKNKYHVVLGVDSTDDILKSYLLAEYNFISTLKQRNNEYNEDEVNITATKIFADYLESIKNEKQYISLNYRFNTALGYMYFYAPTTKNKYGTLIVNSNPQMAYIYIEGTFLGKSTEQFILRIGKYNIEIKDIEKKLSYSTVVSIEPGIDNIVSCILK